jgi:hypothetical protein
MILKQPAAVHLKYKAKPQGIAGNLLFALDPLGTLVVFRAQSRAHRISGTNCCINIPPYHKARWWRAGLRYLTRIPRLRMISSKRKVLADSGELVANEPHSPWEAFPDVRTLLRAGSNPGGKTATSINVGRELPWPGWRYHYTLYITNALAVPNQLFIIL